MADKTFLDASELDFATLKDNLKTFLRDQPQFKDYNFEGSNLSVLLDLLSYNTYLNAFYLNQIGTEMFLDTANLDESVMSHAKELNYIPRSRSSSTAQVNLNVAGNANEGSVSLDKFTDFTTRVGSNTFTFSTNEEIVAINDGSGNFVANNITLFEGDIITEYYEETGDDNRFVISSANVDISSIDVTVQTSNTDFSNTAYARAENLFNLTPTSRVFFVQAMGANKYEIEFGNDVTGRKLTNGNVVRVRYRDSAASDADNARSFVSANAAITATTINKSSGGALREDKESVRFNAPRVFATQDRAVTVEDYRALIKAEFPNVQTLNVIGGENLDPPRFGKVQIVVKPFGANKLTDAQKQSIVDFLKNKVSVSTEVITGDPEFLNLIIDTTVTYNTSQTSKTTQQIKDAATTAILDYGSTQLTEFNNDFRYSRLTTTVDAIDDSVISNNTRVSLAKRISPLAGNINTLELKFGQKIKSESDFGVEALTSSRFFRTINGVRYEAFLQNNGSVVQVRGVVGNSTSVIIANAGSIDFETGTVTLNNFVVTEYFSRGTAAFGDHVNVVVRTFDQDVLADNENILLIESEDVTVNVVGQLTDD